MNDFLAISDSIKQAVSETYSKQNSRVTPEEALQKSKRGGLVFDTIEEIFEEHKDDSNSSSTPFHLMSIDEDSRFSDSRNANKSTRRMAEFLSQQKDSGFNVLDKSSLLQVIGKREQALAEFGYDARNAKIELSRMMDTLELALTQVKSQVEKYMKNTQKQLEAQSSILQKEAELGELTVPAIQVQFKNLLTSGADKPGTVKDVSDMYGILQQKERVTKNDIAKLNGQMIQHSLDAFQEHIEKRKSQISEISQLLPVLDKVMCSLTGDEPSHVAGKNEENSGSPRRMSKFLNKVKGIFGS